MPKKPGTKPISLNEEQQAVVNAGCGMFQVMAGPGAGKSACLVARFARVISEGVDPSSVLSLSFTATAAKNLRDRVESQVGKLQFKPGSGSVTFHSIALTFCQEERDAYPFKLAEFPLATEPVANKLSADAGRRHELDPRHLRPYISLQKRKRIRPASAIKEAEASGKATQIKLALAYKDYDKRLAEAGVLDFDSLIQQMVEILEKRPDLRDRWKRDWIQVDEAQDLCEAEWALVKLLSGKSVLAVGDCSQGIYSFRGSDSKLFVEMDKMFPGTQTLFLACNYRSSPEIIGFIREYSATPELAAKFHTPNPSGPAPIIQGFSNSADEAGWVVNRIKEQLCAT